MGGRGVDAGHGTRTSRQIEVNRVQWKVMEVDGGRCDQTRWSRENHYRKSFEGRRGMDEW